MPRLLVLAVFALAIALPGCDADDASTASPKAASFHWCRAGPQGGGYHIRAVGISCRRVARILPRLSKGASRVARRAVRDPDSGNRRVGESVFRNEAGWTCLGQLLPGRYVKQFLCVRGEQVILYRFA
jgi:hypothetical protein